MPVVGECDDGEMADSRTVTSGRRRAGARGVSAPRSSEGSVGAGTGMTCFGFPGGIGTASRARRRPPRRSAAALQLRRPRVPGPARHRARLRRPPGPPPHGSCIAVCATDAPLSAHQLRRLALRPLLGLARAGSYASEGSGEIGLAFTTATAADICQRAARTPISPPPTRPPTRPSTTASWRPGRPSDSTAADAGRVSDRGGPPAGLSSAGCSG